MSYNAFIVSVLIDDQLVPLRKGTERERGAVTIGNSEFELCTKWREKVRFPLLILAFLCGDYTCHLPFSLMFVRLGGLSPSSASVVLLVSIHLGCSLAPLAEHEMKAKSRKKVEWG